jgi:uncharacterized membrane protein YfcA
MRVLLASPLGFLIGLSLGAFGAGGSIIAVPALVYGAGQGAKAATATSLLLVGTAALVGMGAQLRAGRVRVRTGVLFGLAGIAGATAGTALNRGLNPDVLLLGFSGLIVLAAWRMVTGCPTCTRAGKAAVVLDTRADRATGGRVRLLSGMDTANAALEHFGIVAFVEHRGIVIAFKHDGVE